MLAVLLKQLEKSDLLTGFVLKQAAARNIIQPGKLGLMRGRLARTPEDQQPQDAGVQLWLTLEVVLVKQLQQELSGLHRTHLVEVVHDHFIVSEPLLLLDVLEGRSDLFLGVAGLSGMREGFGLAVGPSRHFLQGLDLN